MNKNRRQAYKAYRKQCKKTGFPPFVFKQKKKPFPRFKKDVKKDEEAPS